MARRPEMARPEMARPEIARPEIARPEMARPEMARPEMARPEMAFDMFTSSYRLAHHSAIWNGRAHLIRRLHDESAEAPAVILNDRSL
ncbi:hypothetical protein GCM10010532_027170 [Dactylosporangium siamense]|uniref:Uncharacterized protein n=1 Tax=Dactylosporangium siamense TaxID=685454 RepID=A0A919U8R8_9ACTN|nr:hypothetical protein Dsi01nite_005020 [Dactylosporangium siamense]